METPTVNAEDSASYELHVETPMWMQTCQVELSDLQFPQLLLDAASPLGGQKLTSYKELVDAHHK